MTRIGRTLPPAASPFALQDLFCGLTGLVRGQRAITELKASLCREFNQKHCFLVSSGKAALTLVLRALHRRSPDRNRVLIPAFTCYSVPSAIVRAGLEVSLCDVDPQTLQLKAEDLEHHLNDPSLLCVVPVHLFGVAADIERIKQVVSGTGIAVVEDAAQAMGTGLDSTPLGTQGDAGIFSLGRGKALSAVEGGVILTNRDDLAAEIGRDEAALDAYRPAQLVKLLVYAFALGLLTHPWLFWFPKSLPFLRLGETIYDPEFNLQRLSGFQAGLARHWKSRVRQHQQVRQSAVGAWRQVLSTTAVSCCEAEDGPWLRFPIRCKNAQQAQQVLEASEQRGLGVAVSYPAAIQHLEAFKGRFENQGYPEAEALIPLLLTLPVHRYVKRSDQQAIVQLIEQSVSSDKGAH